MRLLASAGRNPADGDTDIQLWLLNGEHLTFRVSTRGPIRALRDLVAEHFGCCVGQVCLLLKAPLDGHLPQSELLNRIAEHLNCSPEGVPLAAGSRDYITLTLRDRLSLQDYACRTGRRMIGRLSVVLNDSDAVGHILHI